MSTKWIKKLDEQKTIGCELFQNSLIVFARKNKVDNQVSGIEFLILESTNGQTIDKKYLRDMQNYYFYDLVNYKGNLIDFLNQNKGLLKFLKENSLALMDYTFLDDYSNKFEVNFVDVEKKYRQDVEIKYCFGEFLTKFLFMPYYYEFQIDRFERYKEQLEKQADKLDLQSRLEANIDRKIAFCAEKIVSFYDDYNDLRNKISQRDAQNQEKQIINFEKTHNE